MTPDGKVEVLLVDDDREFRTMGVLVLGQMDFSIESAVEGQEALDFLDAHTPDVILLDLRMPGIDGWQFMEHYTGEIPIVVLSAWWENRPLPREPFALISKPADMREVAVILRQAARSRGRL